MRGYDCRREYLKLLFSNCRGCQLSVSNGNDYTKQVVISLPNYFKLSLQVLID